MRLLRFLFHLLYHQFAWTYDCVAALVSLGCWKSWVQAALPRLNGRVLELGFGPGHLQISLQENGLQAFGLDESCQMARQASRRIRRKRFFSCLTRGYAQRIPFRKESFNCVAATFPSEYIFDPQSLEEIKRVLVPGGRLVILPMAWITGARPLERLVACLMRVVGETPGKPGSLPRAIMERFTQLGFEVSSEIVKLKNSQVLIVVAKKQG